MMLLCLVMVSGISRLSLSRKKENGVKSFFFNASLTQRPPKVATQSSSSCGPLADKPRILLCAPSNGAIDELIGQIAQALIRLDQRKDDRENRKSNRKSTVKEGW